MRYGRPLSRFLLAIALACSAIAMADTTLRYENVVIPQPTGWTARAQGKGLMLEAPSVPGALLAVVFLPSRKAAGKLEDGLEQLWMELAAGSRIVEREKPSKITTVDRTRGLGQLGSVELKNGTQETSTVAIFASGDRHYGVFVIGNNLGIVTHGAKARAILKNLRFDKPRSK
jgi:hypothetical protein